MPETPIQNILVENSTYVSTHNLKQKLFKKGYKEKRCEVCDRMTWLNSLIPLELHHINGVSNDHRIENLQILCPNCHACTDNYRGKNIKNKNPNKRSRNNNCELCQKPVVNKYCSTTCSGKARVKAMNNVNKPKKKRERKRTKKCVLCQKPAVNIYCSYNCMWGAQSKGSKNQVKNNYYWTNKN